MTKNLLMVAGEASGDMHGASLIREIKLLDPEVSISGIGGPQMEARGMKILFHIRQMAFLGFAEVIRHIPFIRKVQSDLIDEVKNKNIDTVVLIDYPGFNLSIAKKFKALGLKVIYYISPQVWAWGKGRLRKIKKVVDKMIVILPFEEKFFKDAGIDVEYVGHPLLEQIERYNYLNKEELFRLFGFESNKDLLLVLPGSRVQEIGRIFPETIKAAAEVSKRFGLQTVVACSSNIDEGIFRQLAPEVNFKVVKDHTYDLFRHAKFGIIKSGTSTLEAALFHLPMVVVYATSYLTYLIGKNLIEIDKISLVNIIAGEKIVQELIQKDVNCGKIFSACEAVLSDDKSYNSMKDRLKALEEKLGTTGVSKRSAEIILEYMN
ncbi:MAG: lipid-A-disaccharide synthase [Syntrophomonadaceae bacterium]